MPELEPVDPDVSAGPRQSQLLGVVALGGVAGSLARYGLGLLWPTAKGAFPWTTLLINVVGSLLLGVVVVLCTEVWVRQRLLRPLLGTGVLGGFTTFSTFVVDQQQRFSHGHVGVGVADLLVTVLAAGAATWVGLNATRAVVRR